MAEPIDEESLKALISDEIHASVLYDSTELSQKRTTALEYYRGEMRDTPAAAGRSSVVSRDVADTMGWILPGIVRTFTASDRMAEFQPVGRGDDTFAKQATDFVNHVFWKDNPGYRILWNATHDSLLQGNGIVKHWWDDAEECEYSVLSGMTGEQIAVLQQDGAEVIEATEGEPQTTVVPGADGQPTEMPVETFDIKIKRVTRSGTLRMEAIPPEAFLMSKEAECIEEARFVAHWDEKTRSDLIEMGFDRDQVENLPNFRSSGLREETQARETEEFDGRRDTAHESMQLIELFECYIKLDMNGDGKAETVRAYYAGQAGAGNLLDWEIWDDEVPFTDIPCEPVPHRWDARSIADETIDVQRVKTVLTRQMLDNMYWVNNPLMVAQTGTVDNPEMLKAPVFGGTLFINSKAQVPPTPLAIPFIGDKALLGLEHFDKVVEKRTGVSRSTMALDPEALQNQTATANQNQRDAAYSQIELIARNMAELGWTRVFKKVLKLIVKHQDRPRTIRLKDEPVEMDPRFWNTNMDVTVNTGLGTGSRDRDMAMLNNILLTQQGIVQGFIQTGFMDKALQMLPKVLKTAAKLAESSGIRNPDEYYLDITEEDVAGMMQQLQAQAEQGDPAAQAEMAKAHAQMQLEQAKMQMSMQLEQAKMQMSMQLEQAKLQAKVQADAAQTEREAAKERAQMDADLVIKQAELQKDAQLEAQRIGFEREKMAEEARQRDLDRQLQITIKQMEIAANRAAQAEQNALQREQGERDADVKLKTAKAKTSEKK